MFTVKAGYAGDIEFRSGIDNVRAFFADVTNFAKLMPGITQIHTDANGVALWRIQAEIPLVGQMLQKFAVELGENTDDRIEWLPLGNEAENYLRYSADFLAKTKDTTLVHFSQIVELRRKKASELHSLAWLAGESLISGAMTTRIAEMITIFVNRAKERLEN